MDVQRLKHEREPPFILVDNACDCVRIKQPCVGIRLHFDHPFRCVIPVVGDLRGNSISVGGEGACLDQNSSTPSDRPVEGCHQHVKIDGQRVHRGDLDLGRLGADELTKQIDNLLLAGCPRQIALKVAGDAARGPFVEFGLDGTSCRHRLQPKRVARQIDCLAPVGCLGDVELRSHSAERICFVER
eukprot:scaffold152654_cov32-Tisochrysis_lutea.AAC.1